MDTVEWIILITDHYKKSHEFYRDILALPVIRETAKEEFTQFKLKNAYLAIYGRKFVKKLIGEKYIKRASSAIYSWSEVDDVDIEYNNLKKQGAHFIKSPTTQSWGQRTAYFTDPDGHIWEIQKWIKQ